MRWCKVRVGSQLEPSSPNPSSSERPPGRPGPPPPPRPDNERSMGHLSPQGVRDVVLEGVLEGVTRGGQPCVRSGCCQAVEPGAGGTCRRTLPTGRRARSHHARDDVEDLLVEKAIRAEPTTPVAVLRS